MRIKEVGLPDRSVPIEFCHDGELIELAAELDVGGEFRAGEESSAVVG